MVVLSEDYNIRVTLMQYQKMKPMRLFFFLKRNKSHSVTMDSEQPSGP